MKRVTIVFDDDELYRAVKIEAARTGRTVKELVTETLRTRFVGRDRMTEEEKERFRLALEACDRVRAMQQPSDINIVEEIRAMREERMKATEEAVEGH